MAQLLSKERWVQYILILRVAHIELVIIMKLLMAIIVIGVTPITIWVKQSVVMLVVNIIMIVMICLVAGDHPVDNLIQGEVMARMESMKAAGWKEVMTFVLPLHIFMVGMSLVIMIGSLLKIILVVVNF